MLDMLLSKKWVEPQGKNLILIIFSNFKLIKLNIFKEETLDNL